jgi:hypothetical protein
VPWPEHVDALHVAPAGTNTTATAPRYTCAEYKFEVPTAHTNVVDTLCVMTPSALTPVFHGRVNDSVVEPPTCVRVPDVKPEEDTVAPAAYPTADVWSFWTTGDPGRPTTGRDGAIDGATPTLNHALPTYENVNWRDAESADHTRLHPGQLVPNVTALPVGGGNVHDDDAGPLVEPVGHTAHVTFTPPAEYVLLPHGAHAPPVPPYPLKHVLQDAPLYPASHDVHAPAAHVPCPEQVNAVHVAPAGTKTTVKTPRDVWAAVVYDVDGPIAHIKDVDAPATMTPSEVVPVFHIRE